MNAPIRALIVTLFLCLPLTAAATSHLSTDPSVTRARALVGNEQFNAALAVLLPLDRDGADRVEILFLTGLAAIGAAEAREDEDQRNALLDEAIGVLRAILRDRPELVRVRLELARAFFIKGEDDLSRNEFERVLAGRPAPPVVANINGYLHQIRERRRWSSYFGSSIAEDSNIGAVSDSEFIYIFGLPFRRGEDSRATSGTGVVVWGGGEYQHPLSERLRLRAGTDLVRREYGGSDFDRTTVAAHVGPRWLVDKDTETSLLGTGQQGWAAGEVQNSTVGVRLEGTRRVSRRFRAFGQISWQHRDVRGSEHLDGPLLGIAGRGTWTASPTVRVDLGAGYNRERAASVVWRSTTTWTRAGVSAALPWGFTAGASGEQRHTSYDGRWGLFTPNGEPRRDRARVLRATLLNRSVTIFGFSPQIALVRESRASNAQLYDYKRTRGELTFQRQF